MQAITTKYHGPTNVRGARIIATADAGRRIFGYDHALNIEANHVAAATAFANDLGWLNGKPGQPTSMRCELISGSTTTGYAHCLRRLPSAKEVVDNIRRAVEGERATA